MKKPIFLTLGHNMKYYTINGMLFTIMLNLYKPYKEKFLERIGGNEFHISLLNALPGLVAVFTIIPGILLLRKFSDKKKISAVFFALSRLFVLLFAIVPLVPTVYQPIFFVILVALMNFPEAISQTALQSYVGSIFVPKQRSTAITCCKKYSIFIQVLVVFISGQILAKLPRSESERLFIYQIFFIIAFIIGIIEISTFLKLKNQNVSANVKAEPLKIKQVFNKIFHDKKFILFVCCSVLFHFGWQMGWPLFKIYQINYLGADEMWLGFISMASSLSMFLSFSYWNKKIIKLGSSKVAIFATMGMMSNAFLTAVSPNLYVLLALSTISGFFTAGTNTIIFALLLEVTPEDEREMYIGVHSTLLNISLFISPFVGHAVLMRSNIFIAIMFVSFIRLLGGIGFLLRHLYLTKRQTTSIKKCNVKS